MSDERGAVYDRAELRFVTGTMPKREADAAASKLEEGRKGSRAFADRDRRRRRYVVRRSGQVDD